MVGTVGAIAAGNVVGTAVIRILPDPKDFNIGSALASQFNGLDVKIAGAAGAVAGVGAALGPVVTLAAGLGAALASAGAGVALFGALAKTNLAPVTSALGQVTKEQAAYNKAVASGDPKAQAAALQNLTTTMNQLTPAQKQVTLGIIDLKTKWQDLAKTVQPQTFGIVNNGLATANNLLPKLAPLAGAAGTALQGVSDRLKNAFTGQGFATGLKQLTASVGPSIGALASTAGNIGVTLGKTFQAALPILGNATSVIQRLTGLLRNGASGSGLQKFFIQMAPAVNALAPLLATVGQLLGAVLKGAAPLALPLIQTITKIGQALLGLARSPAFSLFVSNLGKILIGLTPILVPLATNIGKIFDTLSTQLVRIVPMVVPIIIQLADVFGNIVAGLTPAFPAIIQLVGALAGLIPIVYPIIQAFRVALVPIILALTKAVIQSYPAIHQLVLAIISVLPGVSKMFTALGPLIPLLVSALVPSIKLFADILNKLTPIITFVIQVFVKIAPVLIPLLALFIGFTSPVAEIILIFIALGLAIKVLGALWDWLYKSAVKPAIDGIRTVVEATWKAIQIVWKYVWEAIKIYFTVWWTVVSTWVKIQITVIRDVILAIWHALDASWRFIWNALKDFFTIWWLVVSTFVKVQINIVLTVIRTVLGVIESVFEGAWNGIKKTVIAVWDGILGAFGNVFGALKQAFRNIVSDVTSIWNGIEGVFRTPINIVLGAVNGFDSVVNTVLGVIGVHNLLPTGLKLKAAGGPIYGPGGPKDDVIPALLSNHEHVTNAASADRNRHLLSWMDSNPGKKLPLTGFAGGGWAGFSGGGVATTGANAGVFKTLADKTRAAGGDPNKNGLGDALSSIGQLAISGFRTLAALGLGAVEAPFRAIVDAISGSTPAGALPKNAVNHAFDQINSWVRGNAKKMDDADAVNAAKASAAGVGGGVTRWAPLIVQVLKMLNLPLSDVGGVEKIMSFESGGNPNAINLSDSNAAKGDPSKGLMQTVAETFAGYAGPFAARGIYDPLANIYAGVNYALHTYGPGMIAAGGRRDSSGGYLGYENGTAYVPATGLAKLHQGEMVFPKGPSDMIRKYAAGGPVNLAAIAAAVNKNGAADIKALGYSSISDAEKHLGFKVDGKMSGALFNALQHAVQQKYIALVVANQTKATIAKYSAGVSSAPSYLGGAPASPSGLTDASGNPLLYNAANSGAVAVARGKAGAASTVAARIAAVHGNAVAAANKDQLGAFYAGISLADVQKKEKALYGVMLTDLKTHNTAALASNTLLFKSYVAQAAQLQKNQTALAAAAIQQGNLAKATAGAAAAASQQASVLKGGVASAIAAAYAPAVSSIGASITADAQQGSSITDLFSYQAGYGANSAGAAVALLQSKINRTKAFVLNLKNLAAKGLDPTLIAQLAAAGEGAAGQIALQLVNDPASFGQLNSLESQLANISSQGGAIVGNAAVAAKNGGVVNAAGSTAIDPHNVLGLGAQAGGATLNIYGGVTVRDVSDINKIGQQLYVVNANTQRAAGG